jgi:hypothetical protein
MLTLVLLLRMYNRINQFPRTSNKSELRLQGRAVPNKGNREMAQPLEADGSFYPGKFGPNLKKRYAI